MALKTTPLHGRHRDLGAKLVEFGGFEMPLQYAGILDEHRAVRGAAGVFDVSHMGEVWVAGPQALDFLQFLLPNDVAKLAVGRALYSCMCYPDGGTVDDLLVYRLDDGYLLVVNAANAEKDVAWIAKQAAGFDVETADVGARYGQLAVQGPQAEAALARALPVALDGIGYFAFQQAEAFGHRVLVSRTGYTGEDGFEVYAPPEATVKLWDALIEAGVRPIGLGARDSLRFEACLSLYGHELERDISPIEAGLGWTVKDKTNDFLGKAVLLAQKQNPPRRLAGLRLVEPGVARQGYAVKLDGRVIGAVTSGMKGLSVEAFLALALVDERLEVGRLVEVDVRGKPKRAEVVPMPFYKGSVRR